MQYRLPDVGPIESHAPNAHTVEVAGTTFHLYNFDATPERINAHAAALAARVALRDKLIDIRADEAAKVYWETMYPGSTWESIVALDGQSNKELVTSIRAAMNRVLSGIDEGTI